MCLIALRVRVGRRYRFRACLVWCGMVRAGAGSQNKTCVLLLGHGGEGIWGKNVGFDSLKGQIEPQLQIDLEGPETSENPT